MRILEYWHHRLHFSIMWYHGNLVTMFGRNCLHP